MFVESRPIQPGEHNICPCGQTPIQTSFWKTNGTEIELLWVLNAYTINSNTTLVRRLPTVEHLNPPLIRNTEGQWEVSVMSPKTETLDQGQSYLLRLKAKYNQGSLSLTVV